LIKVDTFRELFKYNYWARDRQLEACAALTQEQFLRQMGSSHSSVRDTLVHLVFAEWAWLERWLGRSPTKVDREEYSAEKFPTLEAVRDRWRTVEGNMRAYLTGLQESVLREPLHYTNFKGERWTYPLWQTIIHLANHQTYHRGQITTLLRQLGSAAPAIDYLVMQDVKDVGAKVQAG
jgi:uncharacterized damage-inducible protein DinB